MSGLEARPAGGLLRQRPFVLLWVTRLLTTIGYQALAVVIGWSIYAITGSAFDLGLVGLLQFIPAVVLTLLIGHAADRYDRRLIVRLAQSVYAICAAIVTVAMFGGWLSRELLFAVVFAIGCARAFELPTGHSLVPATVPTSLLPRAVAAWTSANQVAVICGPALGGFLGAISAKLLPRRETRFEVTRFWYGVAGVLAVLVFVWNLHTIRALPARSYQAMTPLFRVLRIDQLWNMFAPFPLKDDGWWVFPARLADGSEIDLLHPERGVPDYRKPANYALEQENIRWITYRGRLWERQYAPQETRHYSQHAGTDARRRHTVERVPRLTLDLQHPYNHPASRLFGGPRTPCRLPTLPRFCHLPA